MKKAFATLCEGLAKLVEVKSLVTLTMTIAMVALIFNAENVSGEVLALFSSAYGSIITYFFTRKAD